MGVYLHVQGECKFDMWKSVKWLSFKVALILALQISCFAKQDSCLCFAQVSTILHFAVCSMLDMHIDECETVMC